MNFTNFDMTLDPNAVLLNDPMWSSAVEHAACDINKEIIENIPNEINDFDMSGNQKEDKSASTKIYNYWGSRVMPDTGRVLSQCSILT